LSFSLPFSFCNDKDGVHGFMHAWQVLYHKLHYPTLPCLLINLLYLYVYVNILLDVPTMTGSSYDVFLRTYPVVNQCMSTC
jgi:hypothetical protein